MTSAVQTAPPAEGVRVRLYDAHGHDRDVHLQDGLAAGLKAQQLLWVDLDGRTTSQLAGGAAAVGLDDTLVKRVARAPVRADLTQHEDHIHLALLAMEGSTDAATRPRGEAPVAHGVDVLAGRNWVMTVHDGPLRSLDRIEDASEGETRLGALDAAGFLAAIVDEIIGGYLELAEEIEREIDRLDEQALRGRPRDEILVRIVALRRRIGQIRRTLVPHRVAFAAMARPEMDLHDEVGKPWPGLTQRLELAIAAVEGLRELLLGTFDIHMGRAAQDANVVMKRLTLLSAVLLPAVVLAGIMGMNFKLAFFDSPANFWVATGAMAMLSLGILGAAKLRGWL